MSNVKKSDKYSTCDMNCDVTDGLSEASKKQLNKLGNQIKVGVITRHAVPNYGSLLQTYATQLSIEKLGYSCEIIDYIRYDERISQLAITLLNGKKWNNNFFLRFLYKIVQIPNYKCQYKAFNNYREKLLHLSNETYGNNHELQKCNKYYDILCSGSDQIWGKIGNDAFDKSYFLDFSKINNNISYGCSFGKTNLDNNLINNLRGMLKKYKMLLVREDSAKKILIENGFQNTKQVLDPTMLLSVSEWKELASLSKYKTPKEYILVYQLHNNKKFDSFAKKFAKQKRMKLLRISPSIFHITRSGRLVYLPSPSDFLKLFENASYVLTDSFHATVFSIVFNKKFIDIMPNNETGTRIESILRFFEIDNRILKLYDDFDVIDDSIDWANINEILNKERKKSYKLLEESLSLCTGVDKNEKK